MAVQRPADWKRFARRLRRTRPVATKPRKECVRSTTVCVPQPYSVAAAALSWFVSLQTPGRRGVCGVLSVCLYDRRWKRREGGGGGGGWYLLSVRVYHVTIELVARRWRCGCSRTRVKRTSDDNDVWATQRPARGNARVRTYCSPTVVVDFFFRFLNLFLFLGLWTYDDNRENIVFQINGNNNHGCKIRCFIIFVFYIRHGNK